METQFVPYELALKLKELGFDEECFGWWSWINGITASFYTYPMKNSNMILHHMHPNNTSGPLWQQAFDWFRETHDLHTEIRSYTAKKFTFVIQKLKNTVIYIQYGGINNTYLTYEEARLGCLKELIELVESSCQKPEKIN